LDNQKLGGVAESKDQDPDGKSRLTCLVQIQLQNTKVTDEGMNYLIGLPTLRWLHLENTHVTDDGLKRLSGLTNLGFLYFDMTEITEDRLMLLRQSLPNCVFNQ
jgi:hypothetical protein